MGLMDAVVGGIGQAAQGVANTTFEAIRAEIQLNQEKALMSWKEELRQKGMAADDAFKNDPKRVIRDRQNKIDDETEMGQARVDFNIKNAAEIGASEGVREAEKLKAPGLMAAKKEEARATHIESASSIAEANLKKFQLANMEKLDKFQTSYAAAVSSGDKVAANNLLEAMTARFADPSKQKDSATVQAALKVYADPNVSEEEKVNAGKVLNQAFSQYMAKQGEGGATQGNRPDLKSFDTPAKDKKGDAAPPATKTTTPPPAAGPAINVTEDDYKAAEAARARRAEMAAAKDEENRKERLRKQQEATQGAGLINSLYRR